MVVPVITGLDRDQVSFIKGQGAVRLDAATGGTGAGGMTPRPAGLVDSDSADFDGGVLNVSITTNRQPGEDLLGLDDSGSVSFSNNIAGSDISVDGIVFGTLVNPLAPGNDLAIALNAAANSSNVQTLLQSLTYENTNAGATDTSARLVSVTLDDGDGNTSAISTIRVDVRTEATGNFTTGFSIQQSQFGEDVVLGDVDGDGDLDMVTASNGADLVSLNDGSGNFTNSLHTPVSSPTTAIALGDLDGDGDLDMATAAYGSDNRVLFNDGTGHFTDSGQSQGTGLARDIALGDVDGDGDLDMVIAGYGHNLVRLNDGSGHFSDSGQQLGTGLGNGLALGDLDGDGDLDMVTANFGENHIWQNDGTGVFTDIGALPVSDLSTAVALGDLDGDGDLDMVISNYGEENRIWLNDGQGGFSQGQSLHGVVSYTQDVAIADADGDGDFDLFFANTLAGGNQLWLNDGTGSFSDSGQILGSANSQGLATGDLDSDGSIDIAVANAGSAASVWLGNALPVITSSSDVKVDENTTSVMTVTASDTGSTPAFSITGGADAALFEIDAASGALAFVTAPDFEAQAGAAGTGIYEVEVTADDGEGGTTAQTITVTVNDVNEAPVFTSAPTVSTSENTTTVTTVTATDPDMGNIVSFSLTGGADAALFQIDSASGVLSFLEAPDFEAPADLNGDNIYEVEVTGSDGLGGASSQTLYIETTDVNEAPTEIHWLAGKGTASLEENAPGGTIAGVLTALDPENNVASFELVDDPSGLFELVGSTIRVKNGAVLDYETANSHNLTIRATDADGLYHDQVISIDITDVNEAPVIAGSANVSVDENETLVTTLEASDPDALDTLTWAIAGGADAALFDIDAHSGALHFLVAPDFETPGSAAGSNLYELTINVSDSAGLTSTQDLSISVEDVGLFIGTGAGEVLTGTIENDSVYGLDGDDTLYGGIGDDKLIGGNGNDTQYGGDGNDFVRGEAGDDLLEGGAGTDVLRGDEGRDELHGGADRDTLSGLNDNDLLYGDDGDDKLYGGRGDDTLYGGDGNDYARGDQDNDIIYGNAGRDTIRGDAGNDELHGGSGNDRISGNDGDDILYGDEGVDKLYGDAGNDELHGGEGNDYLRGYGDDDILFGDGGNDILGGEQGNDELHGGDGQDLLFAREGDDTLYGDNGNDTLYGGTGSDTLYGGSQDDYMRGESGDDTLFGDDGSDILLGDDGSDHVDGGAGDDVLSGNNGVDFLNGGTGNDRLYGGADTDMFIFADNFGTDTIYDFANDGLEKINLADVTNIADFADLAAHHLSEVGGNTVISDGSNTITVRGIALDQIDSGDFIF